jgi:hypothetical protein
MLLFFGRAEDFFLIINFYFIKLIKIHNPTNEINATCKKLIMVRAFDGGILDCYGNATVSVKIPI